MEKIAFERARASWLCSGCSSPFPDVTVIDATVQDGPVGPCPLNFISGCSVGIAFRDFLFSLGEDEVRKHLYLGKLYTQRNALVPNWVTFNGKNRILVRGSANAQCRTCSVCGKKLYFATGESYLCPAPALEVSIFDKGNGSLVVTEELGNRLVLNKWRDLKYERLSVFSVPKDGLGEL